MAGPRKSAPALCNLVSVVRVTIQCMVDGHPMQCLSTGHSSGGRRTGGVICCSNLNFHGLKCLSHICVLVSLRELWSGGIITVSIFSSMGERSAKVFCDFPDSKYLQLWGPSNYCYCYLTSHYDLESASYNMDWMVNVKYIIIQKCPYVT